MSTYTEKTDATGRDRQVRVAHSTETKAAFKTTQLRAYLLTVAGVLIASAVIDENQDGQGFGAERAWLYITMLTIGYLVSRGLAKAGSYEKDTSDSRR